MANVESVLPAQRAETQRAARPWTAVVAWGALLLTAGTAAVGMLLLAAVGLDRPAVRFYVGAPTVFAFLLLTVSYATVGALLASRRPGNLIGWLFLAFGLLEASLILTLGYVTYALASWPPRLPEPDLLAWANSSFNVPAANVLLASIFVLFPDGRPLSRPWLSVIVVTGLGSVLMALALALRPGPLEWYPLISNPIGVTGNAAHMPGVARLVATLLVVPAGIAAAASMVLRYRRGSASERQQLKWIAYAIGLSTVLLVILLLSTTLLRGTSAIGNVAIPIGILSAALIPIAAGIAILRHRLLDIDLIINRTLAWAILTACLGGLYAASVALFQRIFVAVTGNTSDAVIVITTLLLAGLFTPMRKALEAVVDRRFRYTPAAATASAQPTAAVTPEIEEFVEQVSERVVRRVLAERRRRPRTPPREERPGAG